MDIPSPWVFATFERTTQLELMNLDLEISLSHLKCLSFLHDTYFDYLQFSPDERVLQWAFVAFLWTFVIGLKKPSYWPQLPIGPCDGPDFFNGYFEI